MATTIALTPVTPEKSIAGIAEFWIDIRDAWKLEAHIGDARTGPQYFLLRMGVTQWWRRFNVASAHILDDFTVGHAMNSKGFRKTKG